MGNCMTVEESTVATLESWGKFSGIAYPGFHCVGMGTGVGRSISLKLRQSFLKVRTRTKDNVFVSLEVNVQWQAIQDPADTRGVELEDERGRKKKVVVSSSSSDSGSGSEKHGDQFELKKFDISHMKKEDFLYAAAYSTRDPEAMIKAVVEEFFRIVVNRHKMDKLFDLGESMTSECTRIVNQSMLEYGYCIKKTVVKDIEPSGRTMNNIVSSQKEREAAITRAEAEKTARIKSAEAAAEVSRLHGEGIAKQRYAICEGLKQSVEEFTTATGTHSQSVMSLLMMTQHTDMVRESLTKASGVTLLLKATPTSAVSLESNIRGALTGGNTGGEISQITFEGKDKEKGREKKPTTKDKEAEKKSLL